MPTMMIFEKGSNFGPQLAKRQLVPHKNRLYDVKKLMVSKIFSKLTEFTGRAILSCSINLYQSFPHY